MYMSHAFRGKNGHNDNPDCKTFRFNYRQAVVDYMGVTGQNTNCEPEDVNLLLKLSLLSDKSKEKVASQSRAENGRFISRSAAIQPDQVPSTSLPPLVSDDEPPPKKTNQSVQEPGQELSMSQPPQPLSKQTYRSAPSKTAGNVVTGTIL